MAGDVYPIPAFSFKVVFTGSSGSDTSFQEVSGIKASIETETYKELGENASVLRLPKKITYGDLILKRGIAEMSSPLVKWCNSIFEGNSSDPIEPKSILVHLLDEKQAPMRTWSFVNAFPITWEVDAFSSQDSKVAIEKITLSYESFSRMR
ncbi:MAG: phage tail-like protein [Paraglaciecola sp.]|jgi:phage tail-like protein